jgi:O-antigen/teichoic acid export membrane protein
VTTPASADASAEHRERHEISRLGSGSVLNLGAAVIAQVLTVLAIVILGNRFGASSVGIYSEAFAVRALVSLLCMGGMRNAMTRYVAAYRAADDPAGVRGTVRIGLSSSVLLSAFATVILIVVARPLAVSGFDEPALEQGLAYAAWSLVPATVTTVALSATQGFQTMRAYAYIGSVLDAALRLVFVLAGLVVGGTETAMLGLLVSSSVTAVAALVALGRLMKGLPAGPARYDVGEIGRYSVYSWLSSVANQGLLWADTVILGLYLPSRDVGVYQVATRAVLLATLAVIPLNASFAPLAADLWQRRALPRLQRAYTATAEWLLRISILPLLVIVLFAGVVMRLFGSDFSEGVVVIQIFVAGALVDSWASSAGVALNMSGYNRLNMLDTVGVLVLNVGLNVALIPVLGIAGSAWAWTLALMVYGVVRVVQVNRLVLHTWPIGPRTEKTFLAAAPAIGTAVGARVLLGDTVLGMLVGAALATAVYLAVLARFGLNEEDSVLLHRPAKGDAPAGGGRTLALPAALPRRREELRRRASASAAALHRTVSTRYWRPDAPVPIRTLMSPLRADILVRADFFDFLDRTYRGRPLDVAEIVERARSLTYHEWFRTVAATHVGDSVSAESDLDRAFARRVERSVWLYQTFRERGFDDRRPVLVSWSPDVRTREGKILGPRYQPIDGCHRIALLWRTGVESLTPRQCWVCAGSEYAIDNTIHLLPRLRITPADYARFLSLGFVDREVSDLRELLAIVRTRDGEEAAARLAGVIAADGRR